MKIYQLTNTTAYQMMGYVIHTSDNKVIVIDGGNIGQSEELYSTLKKTSLNVDLWFLTHLHNDHYESIIEIFENHPDVTVKSLWRNRNDDIMDILSPEEQNEAIKWYEFEKRFDTHILYSPKINDKARVGSVCVEILGVSNPEITQNNLNNQSMVIKLTEDDFSVLFLGDLGIEGGEKLLELQGERVRSDAVQMAHHGQGGVDRKVYEAIGAKYAFWPTPKWLWDNTKYLGKGNPGDGIFQTPEVIKWSQELGMTNITSFEKTQVFDTKAKNAV